MADSYTFIIIIIIFYCMRRLGGYFSWSVETCWKEWDSQGLRESLVGDVSFNTRLGEGLNAAPGVGLQQEAPTSVHKKQISQIAYRLTP